MWECKCGAVNEDIELECGYCGSKQETLSEGERRTDEQDEPVIGNDPVESKVCPNCGLTNPDIAQRCDCGYVFNVGSKKEGRLIISEKKTVSLMGKIGSVVMLFIGSLIISGVLEDIFIYLKPMTYVIPKLILSGLLIWGGSSLVSLAYRFRGGLDVPWR